MAHDQKGAEAQQQTILFLDESGFYPLPSAVRTYAPIGQTPVLREWWTRDHLSAISAISPEGKLYFHCQSHALDSGDVVAFLEHLLREVPGRIVLIWDGAPIHRSQVIKDFLTNGVAHRLHVERLPAYAPELNPDEVSGNSSKVWNCATYVVLTCRIYIVNYVMPSNACGGNRALSKAASKALDFRSLSSGQ